ncbi:cytochrome c oxidase subunit II [Rhabdothermincola salaria]|uniref:cytochrome c oxidase subunit II n=1 Tax=Rhabdothermincola salaria TaxID=2903142 RepID=UPI001E31F63C|nr:cytochrome c oxidase subunit II [Rhabdothermincola salaria]MCD9624580.1 cytochrome c oxidase subunit II [Rhabdothermincola salaria]
MPRRSVLVRILQVVTLVVVTVLFVVLIIDSFLNDGKPLTTLRPEGPAAQDIQNLVWPVFLVAGIVFVGVFGAIGFIIMKFRQRDDDDPEQFPEQVHGRTGLEIGWTILPALILAGVAVGTVITIINLDKRADDAIPVKVVGQQFWWSFHYDLNNDGNFEGPEDLTTAGELVVPVGREIEIVTTSNDVIHSFWIPGLNGKKDAVPNLLNPIKLEADVEGVFLGQCTEFCGLSHANMRMLVRSVSQDTYDAWLENQLTDKSAEPTDPDAAEGREIFTQQCAACHLVDGVSDPEDVPLVAGVAPDLTHLMTRGTFAGSIFNLYAPDGEPIGGNPEEVANPGDPGEALTGGPVDEGRVNRGILEDWLRNAPALKPAAADEGRGMPDLGLTEDQIDKLVAYLYTLN